MALYNNKLILQWITFIVYPICSKPQEQRVLVVVSLTRDSSSDLCNNKNSFNIKPGTKEVCLQNHFSRNGPRIRKRYLDHKLSQKQGFCYGLIFNRLPERQKAFFFPLYGILTFRNRDCLFVCLNTGHLH